MMSGKQDLSQNALSKIAKSCRRTSEGSLSIHPGSTFIRSEQELAVNAAFPVKKPEKAEQVTDEPVLCLLVQLGLMLSAPLLWLQGCGKLPRRPGAGTLRTGDHNLKALHPPQRRLCPPDPDQSFGSGPSTNHPPRAVQKDAPVHSFSQTDRPVRIHSRARREKKSPRDGKGTYRAG